MREGGGGKEEGGRERERQFVAINYVPFQQFLPILLQPSVSPLLLFFTSRIGLAVGVKLSFRFVFVALFKIGFMGHIQY